MMLHFLHPSKMCFSPITKLYLVLHRIPFPLEEIEFCFYPYKARNRAHCSLSKFIRSRGWKTKQLFILLCCLKYSAFLKTPLYPGTNNSLLMWYLLKPVYVALYFSNRHRLEDWKCFTNLSAPKSSIILSIKSFLIVQIKSCLILALTIYWKWDERRICSICPPENGPGIWMRSSLADPFSQIHLTTWTSSS